MKHLLALLLILPIAGCLEPPEPAEREGSCIQDLCVLDEPEPHWQDQRAAFGLEQVPLTHDGSASAFHLGDGFLAFGNGLSRAGGPQPDLYALDLEEPRIVPFGTGDHEWANVPRPHGDEVVFGVEDTSANGPGRFSLWMWSFENQTRWRLTVDLEGDKHPGAGFDGEWVVFTNTLRTFRAVELWAYNTQDARLLHLFDPEPRNRHENGTYETVREPVLADGVAYYTVLWLLPSGEGWTDIYATDLETNVTDHLIRLPGIQVNHMDANGRYLTYTNDDDVWVMDLDDGTREPVAMPKTRQTNHGAQVAQQWSFYTSRDGLVQDLVAVNLETGARKVLVEGDERFMPGFIGLQGDLIYIAAQVVNPVEDGPHMALRVFTMERQALP